MTGESTFASHIRLTRASAKRSNPSPRKNIGIRRKSMIKVSVLYPNREGGKFDMAYYCNTHMPLVRRLLSPAIKGIAVEQGIAGMGPGSPAPFVAMGHLLFDSLEIFQTSFDPHAQAIMGDIPNYTDIQPSIQISEVKL
jgi:uncharacterized protein (TIGR02118 family)